MIKRCELCHYEYGGFCTYPRKKMADFNEIIRVRKDYVCKDFQQTITEAES